MNILFAERMALGLLKRHNLSQVEFKWVKFTKRFGRAEYRYIDLQPVRLKLSRPLTRVNSLKQVKETILHEIAHLQTVGHNHDEVWEKQCHKIGSLGCRYFNDDKRTKAYGKVIKP